MVFHPDLKTNAAADRREGSEANEKASQGETRKVFAEPRSRREESNGKPPASFSWPRVAAE